MDEWMNEWIFAFNRERKRFSHEAVSTAKQKNKNKKQKRTYIGAF